ncbi:hypothetical protein [Nocardiopsis aegyptia]|uniref:Uncharacterized protein n=1 Tax=Nocardiopsis aegyptia TaxID=220378 RepID=A0A7Z0JBD6_9ACTN|nr:hypothetical protein [Nocardiopsis aegyptia]NYJ36228.1 hypothetical protein [Nocardiopsis aegyptia]
MRFQRAAKVFAATALAGLTVALLPGAANADEADGFACTESRPLPFDHVTYTCEAESEDIQWRLIGRCNHMFGISFVSSPTVEGSGSATVSCPTAGPIVHLGQVSLVVL